MVYNEIRGGDAMRTNRPLQIYLPPEVREQLAALAERNMRTMTAEVVRALQRHFAEEGLGDGRAAPAPKKTRRK
jgi:hypothetical protein